VNGAGGRVKTIGNNSRPVFGKKCSNLIHCAIGFTLLEYLSQFLCAGSLFQRCHYRGPIIGRKIQEGFDSGVTTFE